jgi:hypothetical protein
MPETTPLIKAALNLRGGAGFDVYDLTQIDADSIKLEKVEYEVNQEVVVKK